MSEPDFGAFRKKLAEAGEELRLSAELAEQVDLHAAAAKTKITEARVEFDALVERIEGVAKQSRQTTAGKGQMK